ncbi:hypothetical protein Tola_0719 [Tolumonas auensis DSM 9187]|uniref:Uncharacterized protein n=1 Tax=Tolumonas auensis (strain DSM 9187 / NBRC 110442 / TA 4) TaxID=595494 RepID=C4LBB2_TOLAT|nr:hypothetical protein [Tolumonas auensis]ACQ92347.1 hypothetical protein Tola_0719 [Tolumonas auensis DSM 9187]
MAYEIRILLGDCPDGEGVLISSRHDGDDTWNDLGVMLKTNLAALLPGLIEQAAEQAGVELLEPPSAAVPVGQLLN